MDSTAWKESQRGSGGGMYCERCADREDDLRKLLEKWIQYEHSGEVDSLYIDLKKLIEG